MTEDLADLDPNEDYRSLDKYALYERIRNLNHRLDLRDMERERFLKHIERLQSELYKLRKEKMNHDE